MHALGTGKGPAVTGFGRVGSGPTEVGQIRSGRDLDWRQVTPGLFGTGQVGTGSGGHWLVSKISFCESFLQITKGRNAYNQI